MKIKRTKLDEMMSRYIRRRDNFQCQRCGNSFTTSAQGLHCHHFYTRRKLTTRWDSDNCVSLCHGCHSWIHGHPFEAVKFIEKRLGKKEARALEIRANTIGKKMDLEAVKIDIENKLKGVRK